jgi:hypothetical protein
VPEMSFLLRSLATAAPPLLVLLVGVVLALVTWRRHRQASLLGALGFVLVAATRLIWLAEPYLTYRPMQRIDESQQIELVLSVVTTVLLTAGYLLMVLAVFVDRRAPYARPRPTPHVPFADEDEPSGFRPGGPR